MDHSGSVWTPCRGPNPEPETASMFDRRRLRQNRSQALSPAARKLIDGLTAGASVGRGDGQEDPLARVYTDRAAAFPNLYLRDLVAKLQQIISPQLHGVYSLLKSRTLGRSLQREKKITGEPDVSRG